MSEGTPGAIDRRQRRRWRFADCVFDEAGWSLVVNNTRKTVETKPLELLRALLEDAGNLVSKDELLDRIWPNVTVVEASLPTAIYKLRQALNDANRDPPIIETVSRVGYRLAVPVHVEEPTSLTWRPAAKPFNITSKPDGGLALLPTRPGWRRPLHLLSIVAGLVVIGAVGTFAIEPLSRLHATEARRPYTQREARDALRRLDIRRVESMLAAGWDPNLPFDDQGNGAINYVLDRCEWDHGHSQDQILLMVRTLTEYGAVVDRRNVWGDTPYSIANTPRFCGPDHPVTRYLRVMCIQGKKPLGDRCMASYELKRGRHMPDSATLEVASR